jgi:flagellar hook-basal body protein
MDSVGNNIANVNTTGYKARRTTFSESFSQLVKGASRSESKAGGTNPMQIGLGVAVGSVDMIMGQGNLQNTGRLLDIGIEGNAFFGVSDGVGTYYTRCGAFQLDAQGYIVLPTNGMVLQGKMADSMGNFPPGTAIGNLQIPLNQQSPAKATTEVTLARNLNMDGDAKGSVTYTQRLLHAADGERSYGANGLNDNGRGKHDTVLTSLYDGNGKSFNMKEGDIITMSFYTDTTYENKIEASFFITGDGAKVNRVQWNPPTGTVPPTVDPTPTNIINTVSGTVDFSKGNMNINSLDDLMQAIQFTLKSYLDTVSPLDTTLFPGVDIDYKGPLSVSLSESGALQIEGVRSDIFGFSIQSSNPNSGKIDESASVTKAFNFGSYLGPGVLGSQTYTANGYVGPVTIPGATALNALNGASFPANALYLDKNGGGAGTDLEIWVPVTVPNNASFGTVAGLVPNYDNTTPAISVVNDSGETLSVRIPGTLTAGSVIAANGIINNSGSPVDVTINGVASQVGNGKSFPVGATLVGAAAVWVPGTVQYPGTQLPVPPWTTGDLSNGTEAIPASVLVSAGTFTQTGNNLVDCINISGKSVNVFVASTVDFDTATPQVGTPIPAGSKNRSAAEVVVRVEAEATSGVLLRPAEQYDYLANVLNANGNEMKLVDGARISFVASIGEDRINSTPLTFKQGSTLLDDLMMQLRNDLKLPYDYMGKDNNNYPSVAIKTPSLGEDGIPEGALVFRGLPGKAFDIQNLSITAQNPGGVALPPSGFMEAMATTQYRAAINAEVVSTTIGIFDDSGAEHLLRFEFTHTGVNGEWIWKASFSGKEIINPPGSGSGKITFGRDGTLAAWLFDDGGSALQFDPANGAKAMRVRLSAGGPGNWKGLTQSDAPSTAQAQTQDGYTSGSLTEMSIDEFGLIEGKFSNGINKKIAQILVVDFANPGGLMDVSDNVYTLSANSGEPIWGRPKNQSSSSLRPGALEMANVDLANEFTNMITTQRGYQANSRIITVSDTMLEEAVNLKR